LGVKSLWALPGRWKNGRGRISATPEQNLNVNTPDEIERHLSIDGADQQLLAGVNDLNFTTLARQCDIRVVLRRETLILSGRATDVDVASRAALRMIRYARMRRAFDAVDVQRFIKLAPDQAFEELSSDENERQSEVALAGAKRAIRPKSPGQDQYLGAIRTHDIVVGIGPAGTGKTYVAVAAAVEALNRNRVRRIILTRPAVEAGEALGFLPGDMQEKLDPYLRPLYDALEDMMSPARVRKAIGDAVIEVAPLAYMRGRTLSDAFLIFDEAQNATTAQMKMFLTRLGPNSKTVITGDKTQIDLPQPEKSGLLEIESILLGVDGIEFVYLDEADVVRHQLVKEIIRAYRDSNR